MPVQRVDRLADQLHPADALEGVVHTRGEDVPHPLRRREEVGRAEPACHLLLRRVGVHGHDPRGAREPRPLQHVQPDPARPDHQDAVAVAHPRPVQHGTHARQHPAADEGGRRQRDVRGDADRLDGLDDRPLRERRVGRELVDRQAAVAERPARATYGVPAHGRPTPVAVGTGPAVGECGQRYMIPGHYMGDAHTHRLHDPGPLMAQHHRNRERYGPVHHRQVAVAQPGRRDRHPHLARPRLAHLQVGDDPDLFPVEDHALHHTAPLGSLGRPSTRSAMIVRWIWSEPP